MFDFFGGRKNFNAYIGVLLVIAWTVFKLDPESLYLALGLLGLTNAAIAFEDSRKDTEVLHIDPPIGTEIAPSKPEGER